MSQLTEMPDDSMALVCMPKGATTDDPTGQWGVTVLDIVSGDVMQARVTFDKDGACSYSYVEGLGLSSGDFDAIAADPLMDLSFLSDSRSHITASGTLSKTDIDGRFSGNMNYQSDYETVEATGTLSLSTQHFDDLAQQYGN